MNRVKNSINNAIKRKTISTILELTSNMDVTKCVEGMDIRYDDVEEILNVPYINHEEVPLAMDIFKPIVPKGTELPVLVTIHGGGLTMGDRKLSRPMARNIAHKGYLVFSVEYRLVPRANICQELDDVCAGLDLIGKKLVDFDVDFTRVFIAAESAGAYLATYVTAMKNSKRLQEAIGYEPSRLTFKAIGLMSPMIYTNQNDPMGWILSEQIYGNKRIDENFLELMNPEHPEIINNLPPTFITTSKGDFINHYSVMFHEALKKAGKKCKFVYYADEDLNHAFPSVQPTHKTSNEVLDKMLQYFEECAKEQYENQIHPEINQKKMDKVNERLKDFSIDNQRIYSYIKERSILDPERIDAPAIIDCTKTYTYRDMFNKWDEYARAFSSLNIGAKRKSRVALASCISAEPLFAFYGLNMVGASVSMFSYPDFLKGGRWKTMVEKERITDLVISDLLLTPGTFKEILAEKEKLGIRNIILLHSLLGGPTVGPAELAFNEFNYHAIKRISGAQYIDELIKDSVGKKIKLVQDNGENVALITHTSGSTNGTRKPLPYTDKAVNHVSSALPDGFGGALNRQLESRLKVTMSFDFSSFLNIGGLANMSFASGYTVVLTGFGFMSPKFARAVKYYGLDVIFTSGFMLDNWIKQDDPEVDLSSLKILSVGGSFVSLEKKKKYRQFAKSKGYKNAIVYGYGMSEAGGASLNVPEDSNDDIIGYPLNKNDFRIKDENTGKYCKISKKERTGILYARSDSMCSNTLDGEELFKTYKIDGLEFVCTNDVVRQNSDGSLAYVGRADKFFVNNDGVRFETGLLENALSKYEFIEKCAIVPIFDKRIHDTVPALYLVLDKKEDIETRVSSMIQEIYKTNSKLKGSALPSQVIVTDDIPLTVNGKIDTFKITRDRLEGSAYNIICEYNDKELENVKLEFIETVSSVKGGNLPEGMGQDSAFNVFDIMQGQGFKLPKFKKIEPFEFEFPSIDINKYIDMNKMMENSKKYMKYGNRMMGLLYKHDNINNDFED